MERGTRELYRGALVAGRVPVEGRRSTCLWVNGGAARDLLDAKHSRPICDTC